MEKVADSRIKLYDSAVKDFERGHYKEAKSKFRRHLMLHPWNHFAYFNFGRCLLKTEEYEAAVEEFGKAISLTPEFIEAYIGLSLAHNLLGEFEKSVIVLKKALEISPLDSNLHYHLGITYEYGIERGKGYKYFKKALSLNPANQFVLYELGNHYYRTKKYRKAIEHLKKCQTIDSQFIPALIRLVEIYENKKSFVKALNMYDRLIKIEPKNVGFYIGKIGLLFQKENFKEASKTLKQAFRVEPDNITLNTMREYIQRHSTNKSKSLKDEMEEIEQILSKQREKNRERIESLCIEIERLKKEKKRLKEEVTSMSVRTENMVKKIKEIKYKYKKHKKIISKLKREKERDERLEKLALEAIDSAHRIVEAHVKGAEEELNKVEAEIVKKIKKINWEMLTKDTRHFLLTAEFLYSLSRQQEIDFGLISVELSKAIEVEVNNKLVNQFCRYLKKNGKEEQFTKENLKKTSNGKPIYYTKLAYLVDDTNYPEIKNLSLGQIKILLEDSIKGYIGTNVFKEFIKTHLNKPDYFLNPKCFPKILETISTKYRNPFAHSNSLNIEALESFRSELFQGFNGGIIVQFLNASKPRYGIGNG